MDTKTKINNTYSETLLAMENNDSINDVRQKLLDITNMFYELSKIDPQNEKLYVSKIKFILEQCRIIREEKSYANVYFNLTGKPLKLLNLDVNRQINLENSTHQVNIENDDKLTKNDETKKDTKPINISNNKSQFNWNNAPLISFDDVAGLQEVKDEVRRKVIMPLLRPDLYDGYDKKNGGGLLLYGPPGTGKTMIAAAIAREINAKFCCVGVSDLLTSGVGASEKNIAQLFKEARSFKCAIIFFDEVESLCPISTHAQVARQVRSELLRQIQGLDTYEKETGNILYLIAATNKPWDIDPAFIRPGRFGTRVYIGLPDDDARMYMIKSKLNKISSFGKVIVSNDIDYDGIVSKTKGFNGADVSYLLDEVQELSIERAKQANEKSITNNDFIKVLSTINTSVQQKDIEKLDNWRNTNG